MKNLKFPNPVQNTQLNLTKNSAKELNNPEDMYNQDNKLACHSDETDTDMIRFNDVLRKHYCNSSLTAHTDLLLQISGVMS